MNRLDMPAPEVYTGPMSTDPELTELKAKVDQTRANALGPHLDTPIYDQLAREYDKKYGNLDYFDSALAQRLNLIGTRNF